MAFSYGFYNSYNGDRRYTNEQIAALFDGLISDGIFDTIGEMFTTIPGDGMQVIVKSGKAWFNHTWAVNDAWYPINLEQPDVTRNRIDAVVLEVNASDEVRESAIKIVSGSYATVPKKPELINSGHVHQYALSYVTVRANVYSLSEEDIEINVGKSDVPFVTGILNSVAIDDLFNAWALSFQKFMTASETRYEQFMSASNTAFNTFMSESNTTFDSLVTNSNTKIDKMITDTNATFNAFMTGSTNRFETFMSLSDASFESMLAEQRSDFENWMDQNENDFTAWWDNIKKTILAADVIGRLQNQIDNNATAISNEKAARQNTDSIHTSNIASLRSDLTSEATTRSNSDATLQSNINTKQNTITETGVLKGLGNGNITTVTFGIDVANNDSPNWKCDIIYKSCTWNRPDNIVYPVHVYCYGGGGGGGSVSSNRGGGGGGSGRQAYKKYTSMNSSYAVVIGSGGEGSDYDENGDNGIGGTGGETKFGTLVAAGGDGGNALDGGDGGSGGGGGGYRYQPSSSSSYRLAGGPGGNGETFGGGGAAIYSEYSKGYSGGNGGKYGGGGGAGASQSYGADSVVVPGGIGGCGDGGSTEAYKNGSGCWTTSATIKNNQISITNDLPISLFNSEIASPRIGYAPQRNFGSSGARSIGAGGGAGEGGSGGDTFPGWGRISSQYSEQGGLGGGGGGGRFPGANGGNTYGDGVYGGGYAGGGGGGLYARGGHACLGFGGGGGGCFGHGGERLRFIDPYVSWDSQYSTHTYLSYDTILSLPGPAGGGAGGKNSPGADGICLVFYRTTN